MFKYNLEIVVFLAGAVVMILELVGSRLLAPFVGTSLYVWASLIGVILASLSLGYYVGGRLADKRPSNLMFCLILLLASVFITFVAVSQNFILSALHHTHLDLRWQAILAALILFAVPSVLLGMISPYAVKLKMHSLNTSGATVGNLYAISTLGSIVGTFAAGFFLIAWLGSTQILFVLALVLIIASALAYQKQNLAKLIVLAFLLSCWFAPQTLPRKQAKAFFLDTDTAYNRVWIFDSVDRASGRPARYMVTDAYGSQGAVFLDNDNEVVFNCLKYYRLADFFKKDINKALAIGGGAYAWPKEFLRRHPSSTIEVVEIDPGLTHLARQYFNLKPDPRLKIYHTDGRVFLNNLSQKYDVIYLDAFNSACSIPFQLTTQQAVKLIYDHLVDGGALLTNIISALKGPAAKFLQAEYATYKSIFNYVYVFPVDYPNQPFRPQNIIMIGLKSRQAPPLASTNPEFSQYLSHRYLSAFPAEPILTDNYAPVEQYTTYLAKVIK
jgi:spermidine synthase